ncbi:MAG: hypothetical protein SGPRY_007485 [Prymnesium sp.]
MSDLLQLLPEASRAALGARALRQAVLLHGGQPVWARMLCSALQSEGLDRGGVVSAQICSCTVDEFLTEYPFMRSWPSGGEGGEEEGEERGYVLRAYPNVIEPGFLFLGNRAQAYDAMVVEKMGITHVVDLHDGDTEPAEPHAARGVLYHNVRIWDREDACLSPLLPPVFKFIERARLSPRLLVEGAPMDWRNNRVLVHCNQGVSRSATCVAYWLMKRYGINADAAVFKVKGAREVADPNPAFMRQLRSMHRIGCLMM